MKSAKSKTTDLAAPFLTKFKTKVLDLSLNLDLSPFVKSAPVVFLELGQFCNSILAVVIYRLVPICFEYFFE